MHLHSKHSWDSSVEIGEYVHRAEQLGFGAISITDHNSTESHSLIDELQKTTNIILIPGQEVSTSDGHLLIYGWIDDIDEGQTMKATVELAKEKGGTCIAAHPYDFFRTSAFSKVFKTGVDGIEVLNASAWVGLPNWMAHRAIRSHQGFASVGNSDSHALREFGSAWTQIPFSKDSTEVLSNLIHGIPQGSRIGILAKIKRFFDRKIRY